MKISGASPVHLTYCMNVHAGESFGVQRDAAGTFALKVREALGVTDRPFGLGLRLGRQGVDEAVAGDIAASFGTWCRDHGLYVFTINGFPYGPFHGTPVKASVYRPDWTRPERLDYTLEVAALLAGWLPDGVPGSISTVPLGYAPDYPEPGPRAEAERRAAVALIACARRLEEISAATGRDLCVGLEPEPWCLLETSAETVRYFSDVLYPVAAREGLEEVVRRRVGVCIDTCHCALAFEQPADVVSAIATAGIRIAKIQISAALSAGPVADPLIPFAEPVYFHQAAMREGGRLHRWPDLGPALAAYAGREDLRDLRVHFHVPLHWEGGDGLRSTRDTMDGAFWARVQDGLCPHLEIETYTFDALPRRLGVLDLASSLEAEYRWVLHRMPPGGEKSH